MFCAAVLMMTGGSKHVAIYCDYTINNMFVGSCYSFYNYVTSRKRMYSFKIRDRHTLVPVRPLSADCVATASGAVLCWV